jgi:hypothetical protein
MLINMINNTNLLKENSQITHINGYISLEVRMHSIASSESWVEKNVNEHFNEKWIVVTEVNIYL